MSALIDLILRRISREGLPRFLNGDSVAWAILGAGAFLLHRSRQRGNPVVSTVEMHPGERYLITLTDPR